MATPRPDVLVVSPYPGGHHAEYLRWIVEGLAARGARVAVGAHPALDADALDAAPVRLVGLDRIARAGSLWAAGRATGAVVREAVQAARAPRVFLPYLDHTQLALGLGLRFAFPVAVSGILLRPTLHETPISGGDRVRHLRKRALLRLAARNPHLGAVLALDPDAVAPLGRLGLDARFLPDPVVPPSPGRSRDQVRQSMGIEAGRRLLLLFGSLEERKGVLATLDALGQIPTEAARQLALVVVGRADSTVAPRLAPSASGARRTGAQVVVEDRFVPDAELDDLVAAADVVLAPYLGHVGSSGVVLRAAAAGTPAAGDRGGHGGPRGPAPPPGPDRRPGRPRRARRRPGTARPSDGRRVRRRVRPSLRPGARPGPVRRHDPQRPGPRTDDPAPPDLRRVAPPRALPPGPPGRAPDVPGRARRRAGRPGDGLDRRDLRLASRRPRPGVAPRHAVSRPDVRVHLGARDGGRHVGRARPDRARRGRADQLLHVGRARRARVVPAAPPGGRHDVRQPPRRRRARGLARGRQARHRRRVRRGAGGRDAPAGLRRRPGGPADARVPTRRRGRQRPLCPPRGRGPAAGRRRPAVPDRRPADRGQGGRRPARRLRPLPRGRWPSRGRLPSSATGPSGPDWRPGRGRVSRSPASPTATPWATPTAGPTRSCCPPARTPGA